MEVKKNIRLLKTGCPIGPSCRTREYKMKKVQGGMLVQTDEDVPIDPANLKVVTNRAPTEEEIHSLLFAWKLAKHVTSNAVVYVRGERAVGIGAGQMSRVDSAKIATMKANEPTQGCVMASDAFFPFRDGVGTDHERRASARLHPEADPKACERCNCRRPSRPLSAGCAPFRTSFRWGMRRHGDV